MDKPENRSQVPTPAPEQEPYSRAAQLLKIVLAASFQMRQDCDHKEQEDLALATRLQEIDAAVRVINANDKLLK